MFRIFLQAHWKIRLNIFKLWMDITSQQRKGQVHNVLLSPYICDRLFSLMHLRNTFYKGFYTACFGDKEKNAVTLPHSAHQKNIFFGKINSYLEKLPPRKKIALELLHQKLGHISTRSLMAGDTANVLKDIELFLHIMSDFFN